MLISHKQPPEKGKTVMGQNKKMEKEVKRVTTNLT